MIHMALRKDFVDFIACMNSVVDRLDKGIALPPWQTATLQRWFDFHARAVHHHHRHEEGESASAMTHTVRLVRSDTSSKQ